MHRCIYCSDLSVTKKGIRCRRYGQKMSERMAKRVNNCMDFNYAKRNALTKQKVDVVVPTDTRPWWMQKYVPDKGVGTIGKKDRSR